MFQWMFSKKLNRFQWYALVLIMMGSIIIPKDSGDKKKANRVDDSGAARSGPGLINLVMIALQVLFATFASVYNEALLKKDLKTPINLQNIFMYLNSMMFNILGLCLDPSITLSEVFSSATFLPVLSPTVFPVILLSASAGIVTSLFLKHLNSVLKTLAAAVEAIIIPVVQFMVFGIPITLPTVVSVALVSGGIYLYSAKPAPASSVDNATEKVARQPRDSDGDPKNEDSESLLEHGSKKDEK